MLKKIFRISITPIMLLVLLFTISMNNVYASKSGASTPTFIINADRPLSFDTMKSQIHANDETEGNLDGSIVFSESTYVLREDGKCAPGTYSFKATISDSSGNTSTKVFNILATDVIAPIIQIPDGYKITTLSNLTLDDIKALITVVDGIDGAITDFSITDDNNYLANTKAPGSFNFTITATDSSGNTSTAIFTMQVEDKDIPEITWDENYVIVITQGQALTKTEIIEFLVKSGQVEEAEVSSVECAYFAEGNDVPGVYSLTVGMNDGSTYKSNIRIVKSMSNNSNPEPEDPELPPVSTEEEESKNIVQKFLEFRISNPTIFWSSIAAGALVIILIIAGVVIIIKKKLR